MSNPRRTQDLERLETYLKRGAGPYTVVYDIGTRAARVLVGPSEVPEAPWSKTDFCNTSLLTNLGAEMDRFGRRLDPKGRVMRKMLSYIADTQNLLASYGVEPDDTRAVGTAVFRWLENQEEILDEVETRTGVRIKVLKDDVEALYSLASVWATHSFGHHKKGLPEPGTEDAILLLDQGGGSMEVSYIIAGDFNRYGVHSFDELGTIALRERFFHMGKEGKVDPETNRRRISTQNSRITEFVQQELEAWSGFPEIEGRSIHAYGMGSALTKSMTPNKPSYFQHNALATIERMEGFVEDNCSRLDRSRQQVRTVWGVVQKQRTNPRDRKLKKVAEQMVALYGLPVYAKVLRKFGLDHLRVCGYGMRYGVYVLKCKYDVEL